MAFRASLEAGEPDVLPLWFGDAQIEAVARTIDPGLSTLAPGDERFYPATGSPCAPGDLVLSTAAGLEGLLAARYSTLTGRRMIRCDETGGFGEWGKEEIRSIAWFCRTGEEDLAGALRDLRGAFSHEQNQIPRIGLLTAESPARLSWLLAKQLIPLPENHADPSTTLVTGGKPPTFATSLTQITSDQPAREIIAGISAATGTLLLNAHSRPHCGLLGSGNGIVGVCGLSSGGSNGACVDGSACHFGLSPRVVLQNLRAWRVFFNGCTTAGAGTRRQDFVPPTAMVSHATLRGRAREYIGNVRSGIYCDADLDCLLGAAALGYDPAECVAIIESARKSDGRERMDSALYFGDPTNPPWPVCGVSVGSVVSDEEGRLRISWPNLDRVLVARVIGRRWADLANQDLLHVQSEHASNPTVRVFVDPWSASTLVMALPQTGGDSVTPVIVDLRPLAIPLDRGVGGVLRSAVERVRWLENFPAFGEALRGASADLGAKLVLLCRGAAGRENVANLPALLAAFRNQEAAWARQFDRLIVRTALSRAQEHWNWSQEYAHRVNPAPSEKPSRCPMCGGFASKVAMVDSATPRMSRRVKACGCCGIVADLPGREFGVRMTLRTLAASDREFTGRVELANSLDRPRTFVLGAAVRDAGRMLPSSKAIEELTFHAKGKSSFDFSLHPEKPMSKMAQTWIFVACEGAFGLIGRIVLFGRDGRS